MSKVQIFNARRQQVGEFDTEEKVYFTTRNYLKGQIFREPKYQNSIGVDISILKQLIQIGCKKIRMQIINFKRYSFIKELDIDDFLIKSQQYCADKYAEKRNITYYSSQRILPMHEWNNFDKNQKILM